MAQGTNQVKEDECVFMACRLEVNVHKKGWPMIVSQVLKNMHGVNNFRMDEDGVVEVSGTVDHDLLFKTLQKAGIKAKVCKLQFGLCFSNLYFSEKKEKSAENGGNSKKIGHNNVDYGNNGGNWNNFGDYYGNYVAYGYYTRDYGRYYAGDNAPYYDGSAYYPPHPRIFQRQTLPASAAHVKRPVPPVHGKGNPGAPARVERPAKHPQSCLGVDGCFLM